MTPDGSESRVDQKHPVLTFGVRLHVHAIFAPIVLALPIAVRFLASIEPDLPGYMVPACDVVAGLGLLQLVWMASWRAVVSSTELALDLRLYRRAVRWSDVQAFETTKQGLLILRTAQRRPLMVAPKLYRRSEQCRAAIVSRLGEPTLVELKGLP
jgi:hypothetical protein